MATNLPRTSREKRQKVEEEDHDIRTKYSTAFSNKLIDLAISADAEVAQLAQESDFKQEGQSPCSESVVEDFEMPPDNWINVEACKQEASETARSLAGGGFGSNTNFVIESEMDDRGSGQTELNLSSVPHSSVQKKRLNGFKSDPNLLTVFSSPCGDYFPSKQSESDEELPEYVRIMMEKDVALKRLVKTGSVTISQVKSDDSADIESFVGDDFGVDAETAVTNGLDLSGRPFAPLAKLEEWETFPFAKRLLELAHLSVSDSLNQAPHSPPPPKLPTSNGNAKHRKTLSGKVQTVAVKPFKKVFKEPNSTPTVTVFPKQLNKSQRSSLETAVMDLAASDPAPEMKTSVAIKRVKVVGKKNSKKRKRAVHQPQPEPVPNYESESEEQFDCFQFDPLKFLEVSLQVGKAPVPEDSLRRKYKCAFCDKKFCWSTDLKRHTLIHTGERPFKCSECPATFTRKFLMQKHIKKAHHESLLTEGRSVSLPAPTVEGDPLEANEEAEESSDWNAYANPNSEGVELELVEERDDETELTEEKDNRDSFDELEIEEVGSDEGEEMDVSSFERGVQAHNSHSAYLDF